MNNYSRVYTVSLDLIVYTAERQAKVCLHHENPGLDV
jgi:hypothetical protein